MGEAWEQGLSVTMGQQFDSPYTVLEVQYESTLCSVH